ncbi:adhesion G-protein coupled receptor F2 [Anableps anableps]
MWVFMFLYMLSLNISQAVVTESSTQMYYAKLIIDRSAIEKISERLNFHVSNHNVSIEDVTMTTGKKETKEDSKYMKTEYSKIRGFDSLTITKYSVGSIIVDFAMKIIFAIESQDLFQISRSLTSALNGSLILETKGVVSLKVPRESVLYNNNNTFLQCTTQEDLRATPLWNLKRKDGEFLITNGTISSVSIQATDSTVTIQQVDELWQGEYICLFVQKENTTTINHKANATMDVCLLPKIDISANPAFPLSGDKYCSAEGDWGNTKANFTAEIKCKNKAGTRKRACVSGSRDHNGKWEDEVSECVEQDLFDVLETAKISDIGLGELTSNAAIVFERFEKVTKTSKLPGYANINTSVAVLSTMNQKLEKTFITNESAINNFLISSSHLLNKSLESSWNALPDSNSTSLMADRYMVSVESLIKITNITERIKRENLEVAVCNSSNCNLTVFNVKVFLPNGELVKTAGFRHLESYLQNNNTESEINSIIVSTTAKDTSNIEITIDFDVMKPRPRNVELKCVFWDTKLKEFSEEGCKWAGPTEEGRCVCNHLSSFAILLSKEPLEVPGLTYVTYVALSVSVLSLIITLVIEMVVWSEAVKTNTLYLRHVAHVNICLCLLIGNLCFLASSSNPESISDLWCRTSAVLKHFCYLAMFFWTFCLSTTLLHQAVFLFHKVSKKNYLRFSLVVGYVVPLLIVFITFLTNDGGAVGKYYLRETCWLVYDGLFKGTFFTFIIPVGAIIFINVFSMLVVIMKLISHHSEIHQKTDISPEKEKAAAKTVVRSIILLTPIFGVTWIFGFAILIFDLTSGVAAYAFEYIFTILNGFQGFFILLTTCFGDRLAQAPSVSDSTSKSESAWKK